MSNSFFNNTIDLVGGTKARAADVESNFNAVATGFDGVETALNLKAPAASPTFTGVPVAPTAAPGTSSFQLATTQFVANAALTAVLPGQGGNSGKYLKTDGSNASWEALSLAWGSITGTPTTLTGYGLTMSAARTELGATTVGSAVFTAATEAAGRTALGASTVGANVFTAATAADARTQLGGGVTGQDVFTASTAAAARTAIGAIASGGDIGAATATTQPAKTASTTVATTAFVDALRSMLSSSTTGTAVIGDRGCSLHLGADVTVPASVFAARDVFTLYNNNPTTVAIVQGAGLTLRKAGTATTGNLTLNQRGIATVYFVSATEAVVSGSLA